MKFHTDDRISYRFFFPPITKNLNVLFFYTDGKKSTHDRFFRLKKSNGSCCQVTPAKEKRSITMTARGSPSRFLQSILQNGVGRYVCQLKRLTLTFSKDAQPSRGAREFIEEKIVDFAKQNPSVVLYVNPKPCRVPKLVGEYLNGTVREEAINSKTAEQITELVQKMANQSGLEIIRIRKPQHTDNPSIQGQWHPFTNKSSTINIQLFDAVSQQAESQP